MHGTNNITSFNGALHGTNNITSFNGALHGTNDITSRVNYCKSLGCMEQTTSVLLWALHGTNNITSSMGIAWNKQHHFFYGHCMEQTTSLLPWALQEHLHHLLDS
jgi:hypothetical protein